MFFLPGCLPCSTPGQCDTSFRPDSVVTRQEATARTSNEIDESGGPALSREKQLRPLVIGTNTGGRSYCQLGGIVHLAEVGEHHLLQMIMENRLEEGSGIFIGQMPLR